MAEKCLVICMDSIHGHLYLYVQISSVFSLRIRNQQISYHFNMYEYYTLYILVVFNLFDSRDATWWILNFKINFTLNFRFGLHASSIVMILSWKKDLKFYSILVRICSLHCVYGIQSVFQNIKIAHKAKLQPVTHIFQCQYLNRVRWVELKY